MPELLGNHSADSDDRRLEELPTNWDIQKIEQHFNTPLIRNWNELKQYEQVEQNPSPWTSSYWPTYQDSINARWRRGQPSPAEKYARAYGLDVK
ncbi:TPA: hypothetical protein N0F65_002957, partial [Lagenidium giganteum]